MLYGAPSFGLSIPQLRLATAYDLRFRRRQGVIGINPTFGLYQHSVLLLGELRKVSRAEVESFEHLSGITT
jgi:hypothetical protein